MPSPADVEVIWRSFELDPEAPRVRRGRTTYAERLARKYRSSLAQAEATIARLRSLGAAEGIGFRLDRVRPGSTFDAHRVLHLARERGVQGAVKERLMRAYFTEGEALGDRNALVRLAAEAGLDPGETRRALARNAYGRAVRADEAEARANGVHAVPFFGVADTYAVTGAQSVEVMHGTLLQAWTEAAASETPGGAACGPEGCA